MKRFWFFVMPLMFFGEFLVFYLLFLMAFFSPKKRALLLINELGEANIELIIFTGLLVVGLIWIVYWFKWGRGYADKILS